MGESARAVGEEGEKWRAALVVLKNGQLLR